MGTWGMKRRENPISRKQNLFEQFLLLLTFLAGTLVYVLLCDRHLALFLFAFIK